MSFGEDRSYAGNDGYADVAGRSYAYDSFVPNHKRVKPGDLVLVRDQSALVGTAQVSEIRETAGIKRRFRCPECNTATIYRRKTVSPVFRCIEGHVFDQPNIEEANCTTFVAALGRYSATSGLIPLEALRSACPRFSPMNAIQEIDLHRLAPQLLERLPEYVRDSISSTQRDSVQNRGDTAILTSESRSARLLLDGPCLRDTIDRLSAGSSGKYMDRDAVQQLTGQAVELLSDVVNAYAQHVAVDEVGAAGSGTASTFPPISGECPTGLMYGLIQSGKTAAMIVSAALAIDNGFRVIVVLTSNNVKLVEQTSERFEALEGPLIYSSTSASGGEYEWEADRGNIERRLGTHGAVFVCAKESRHQRALLTFLREIGASNYPALIFDDEADQATPDTTLAARSALRPNAPAFASTTYRLTVENDAPTETGDSLREVLKHHVFVQVTATPYGLLLQHTTSPLRPKFTRPITPGSGYCGGELFFEQVENEAQPPLVYIDDHELQQLQLAASEAPEGLAHSIAFFLVAAVAHALREGRWPDRGYKHLSHTSPRTAAHDHLAVLIRSFTDELGDALADDISAVAARPHFEWAHAELSRTYSSTPSLHEILLEVRRRIARRKIITINAQGGEAPFGPYFNFMVGGNILGRGLTIDDLLVTYYLRQAQTTQMDTMLQHARMYGYRERLMPFTRVFLPYRLALRFHAIHESERLLRDLIVKDPVLARIPISVINNLRPTRPGILDAGRIGTYGPGQQVYPIEPVYERDLLGDSTRLLDDRIADLAGGSIHFHEWISISTDQCRALIEMAPVRADDPSEWDSAAISQILLALSDDYPTCELYCRPFERTSRILQSGGISGAELTQARSLKRPVLFMLRESAKRSDGRPNPWQDNPFWYPTIVFPETMANQVFNASR